MRASSSTSDTRGQPCSNILQVLAVHSHLIELTLAPSRWIYLEGRNRRLPFSFCSPPCLCGPETAQIFVTDLHPGLFLDKSFPETPKDFDRLISIGNISPSPGSKGGFRLTSKYSNPVKQRSDWTSLDKYTAFVPHELVISSFKQIQYAKHQLALLSSI